MLDFELAAHEALTEVFPDWSIRTCHFHFYKNIIDKIKKLGLSFAFNNSEFNKWLDGIMGKFNICIFFSYYNLGSIYLPENNARYVFEYLLNNLPSVQFNLTAVVTYLRNFWLPKLDKVVCWNNDQPNTNNPAEAYHSKLSKAFNQLHNFQVFNFKFFILVSHIQRFQLLIMCMQDIWRIVQFNF